MAQGATCWLGRKGVGAEREVLIRSDASAATGILDRVEWHKAGVIVASGIGSPAGANRRLGGVTYEFLAGSSFCHLLSH